jgi:predicted aconitase
VIQVVEAKLYVTVTNNKKYMYINYFDPEAGRVKHIYVGSPYAAARHLERLKRILKYWDRLDPASKKTFLEALSEVEAKLNELKAQLKS